MRVVISNPPYNMKWEVPILATMQERFSQTVVPPCSNANFAFVLTALNESDRCVLLLPCGVLTTNNKDEKEIIKYLVEMNFIESIITCPDNMFENTGISTCIIVLDKNKDKSTIEMIDLRDKYEIEIREQKGQFGSKAHTNRTYKKQVKVLNDEIIDDVLNCIEERKTIKDYCRCVSIQEVEEKEYKLNPSMYFEIKMEDFSQNDHRDYKDIVNDLNRIIKEKNKCKLTINENLAKNIGFDIDLYKSDKEKEKCLNDFLIKLCGEKIINYNYFQTTKNKNEVIFKNNDIESVSSIFMMTFQMWKQHIYYLNLEENRYLMELRDALLPELIGGKIDIEE